MDSIRALLASPKRKELNQHNGMEPQHRDTATIQEYTGRKAARAGREGRKRRRPDFSAPDPTPDLRDSSAPGSPVLKRWPDAPPLLRDG
jgi:hypothetical protein